MNASAHDHVSVHENGNAAAVSRGWTADALRRRLDDLCANVCVAPLQAGWFETVWRPETADCSDRSGPVCAVTPGTLRRAMVHADAAMALWTFPNWLRTGFRIHSVGGSARFEVFKGFGLTLPDLYVGLHPTLERLYGFKVTKLPPALEQVYAVLEVGDEVRVGGGSPMSLLLPDARGYTWLQADSHARLPQMRGVYALTDAYCQCMGFLPGPHGQNVRSFANPFRIEDLRLLRALCEDAGQAGAQPVWRETAACVAALSMDLTPHAGDPHGYLRFMARSIGHMAGALSREGILHGQLTDHCQNVTLGGELTEFDYAVKVPLAAKRQTGESASRLTSQVLLLGNHVRQLSRAWHWLGFDSDDRDLAAEFAAACDAGLAGDSSAALRWHLEFDPYCQDIARSSHNALSQQNLHGSAEFNGQVRAALLEAWP